MAPYPTSLFMTVDLTQLLVGLLLLWFPRQWMRLGLSVGTRRRRTGGKADQLQPWERREPGDPRISFRLEFSKVRNYVDLLRAAAGGLAIVGGFGIQASLAPGGEGQALPAWQVLALQATILGLGVLTQILRYERRHVSLYPPIFYLSGLSLGLCSAWPALFAFVLIWGLNPMLGGPQGFLSLYALLLLVFGVLFRTHGLTLPMVASGLFFLPVLLSLLARRPLVNLTRKPAPPTGTAG